MQLCSSRPVGANNNCSHFYPHAWTSKTKYLSDPSCLKYNSFLSGVFESIKIRLIEKKLPYCSIAIKIWINEGNVDGNFAS